MTGSVCEVLRAKTSEITEMLNDARGFVRRAEVLVGDLADFEKTLDRDVQAIAAAVEKLKTTLGHGLIS